LKKILKKNLIIAYLIFIHFVPMVESHINRIPIIDNNKLVGIVTRSDIIKTVAACG
jgi:CBS domain-containing protein